MFENVDGCRAEVQSAAGHNLLQVRTYDCLISYDKHYQTPRFWLFGYDEVCHRPSPVPPVSADPRQNRTPLSPAQVFQDVPADYAFKTMTMEAFPHSGQQLASVHPCKHAAVMKKFIDRMEAAQADPVEVAKAEAHANVTAQSEKKRWGLGGMVRKATGGTVPSVQALKEGDEEEAKGVQVDFYLVIVSRSTSEVVKGAKLIEL